MSSNVSCRKGIVRLHSFVALFSASSLLACSAQPRLQGEALGTDTGELEPVTDPRELIVHAGVDLGITWEGPDRYQLYLVITFSPTEVRLKPGGDLQESEEVLGCTLNRFDPGSMDHARVDRTFTYDMGPSVLLQGDGWEIEVPAVDLGPRRYYLLDRHSDTLSLDFPLELDLTVPGPHPELPPLTIESALRIPEPIDWLEPAELLDQHCAPYLELDALEPLELAWQPAAAPLEEERMMVTLNATGTVGEQEFWEQLGCSTEDDGAFLLSEEHLAAMTAGEPAIFRSLFLSRSWSERQRIEGHRMVLSAHAEQRRFGCYDAI
jgi:hypothetical protein